MAKQVPLSGGPLDGAEIAASVLPDGLLFDDTDAEGRDTTDAYSLSDERDKYVHDGTQIHLPEAGFSLLEAAMQDLGMDHLALGKAASDLTAGWTRAVPWRLRDNWDQLSPDMRLAIYWVARCNRSSD